MRRLPGAAAPLLLLAASMPFWGLGHPLWEIDDARYAEIPREMVESGDWLTPRLNYIEYLEKPPLVYWLGALSYKAFGVSEAAARLPTALLALLGLAGTAWLGSWLFSPQTGLAAAVMLGGCVQYSLLSHVVTPDMALSVFLLWACALLLRGMKRPEDARWAGPAAGLCMALAFLSKGLVGLLFPALWTCALALLFPELRKGFPRLWALAAPVLLLPALLWLRLMAARHPGFLQHFFVEQQFSRYLTPRFNRPGGWHYFLAVDLAGLLPWTPPALASMAATALGWRRADPALRQLLLWVALVLGFFTASGSKLPTYILPAFPQQCLLAAGLLFGPDGARARAWSGRVARVLGACALGLSPLALLPGAAGFLRAYPGTAWAGAGTLLSLGAGLLLLGRGEEERGGWRILAPTALCAAALNACLLLGARAADRALGVRQLSSTVLAQWRPGDLLISYDFYPHGLPFYLRQPVDVVNWVGEFYYRQGDPRYAPRFVNDDALRCLPESKRRVFLVLPTPELRHVAGLPPIGMIRRRWDFGRWSALMLSGKGRRAYQGPDSVICVRIRSRARALIE